MRDYYKILLPIYITFEFRYKTDKGTEVQKNFAGIVEELKKKDVYIIKCKHNTEKPKWKYYLDEPKE